VRRPEDPAAVDSGAGGPCDAAAWRRSPASRCYRPQQPGAGSWWTEVAAWCCWSAYQRPDVRGFWLRIMNNLQHCPRCMNDVRAGAPAFLRNPDPPVRQAARWGARDWPLAAWWASGAHFQGFGLRERGRRQFLGSQQPRPRSDHNYAQTPGFPGVALLDDRRPAPGPDPSWRPRCARRHPPAACCAMLGSSTTPPVNTYAALARMP